MSEKLHWKLVETNKTITITGCKNCVNLVIPDEINGIPVTTIGAGAFSSNYSLSSVVLGKNIKEIYASAFYDCKNLKTVSFNDGLKTIGQYAFSLTSLKNVKLPNGLESIGSWAFAKSRKLQTIILNDDLENIGNNVFFDCSSLESLSIPDSVTWVASDVVRNCRNLKTLHIGKAARIVGPVAESCTRLENITVHPDNENHVVENGVLYNQDKTVLIRYSPCKNATIFKVPETVRVFCSESFDSVSNLKEIRFSQPVIKGLAASRITELKSIKACCKPKTNVAELLLSNKVRVKYTGESKLDLFLDDISSAELSHDDKAITSPTI